MMEVRRASVCKWHVCQHPCRNNKNNVCVRNELPIDLSASLKHSESWRTSSIEIFTALHYWGLVSNVILSGIVGCHSPLSSYLPEFMQKDFCFVGKLGFDSFFGENNIYFWEGMNVPWMGGR